MLFQNELWTGGSLGQANLFPYARTVYNAQRCTQCSCYASHCTAAQPRANNTHCTDFRHARSRIMGNTWPSNSEPWRHVVTNVLCVHLSQEDPGYTKMTTSAYHRISQTASEPCAEEPFDEPCTDGRCCFKLRALDRRTPCTGELAPARTTMVYNAQGSQCSCYMSQCLTAQPRAHNTHYTDGRNARSRILGNTWPSSSEPWTGRHGCSLRAPVTGGSRIFKK